MKMNEKTINIDSNLTVKLNTTDSSYIMYVYKMLNELYDYGTFDYDIKYETVDDDCEYDVIDKKKRMKMRDASDSDRRRVKADT